MNEYLTVTRLNQYIKSVVESDFSLMNISLVGEVSSLTKHYTGHFYFTLKDESSQIRCMMFSSYASKINFNLKNGDQILINGYIGVYDKGGTYQVYCRKIEPYGEGQYLLQLAQLKEKLQKEGILDKEKLRLPLLPRRIALITAKTGAAIHDFISTVKKRMNTEIYVFPCLVQGDEAPKSILKSLQTSLNFSPDLIVVTRGGGSKEDLKAFNDEDLVRFAADLNIPLISAVGHQIDTTLIDYVSALRCITPTDAAVNAVPTSEELIYRINHNIEKGHQLIDRKINSYIDKLLYLTTIIESRSPINITKSLKDKLNNIQEKIVTCINFKLNKYQYQIERIKLKFNAQIKHLLLEKSANFYRIYDKIEMLNPQLNLKKGYAYIDDHNKRGVTSIEQITINEIINIHLNDGIIEAKVEKIIKK